MISVCERLQASITVPANDGTSAPTSNVVLPREKSGGDLILLRLRFNLMDDRWGSSRRPGCFRRRSESFAIS